MAYLLAAIMVQLVGLIYCVGLLAWRVRRWNRLYVTQAHALTDISKTLRGIKGEENANGNSVSSGRV